MQSEGDVAELCNRGERRRILRQLRVLFVGEAPHRNHRGRVFLQHCFAHGSRSPIAAMPAVRNPRLYHAAIRIQFFSQLDDRSEVALEIAASDAEAG